MIDVIIQIKHVIDSYLAGLTTAEECIYEIMGLLGMEV
jgi:hypothetical protein